MAAPQEVSDYRSAIIQPDVLNRQKRQILCDMNVFVIDNSLRESTVGQVVGHSLNDKYSVLAETKKCSFNHQIIATFSHQQRVDDAFCE